MPAIWCLITAVKGNGQEEKEDWTMEEKMTEEKMTEKTIENKTEERTAAAKTGTEKNYYCRFGGFSISHVNPGGCGAGDSKRPTELILCL